ncbi:MAG: class II aldolase/adducin family protein [Myxococcota bacterium]|nr:class II aldolase/adducin family protein [Myxococcota bacterium]
MNHNATQLHADPEKEGVTKFSSQHKTAPIPTTWNSQLQKLLGWRTVAFDLGAIGIDPNRYQGLGYGNFSIRIPPAYRETGKRSFLVTCTQTSGPRRINPDAVCAVLKYSTAKNAVVSMGPCRPSSESLTHATIYDLDFRIQSVIHGHIPNLWRFGINNQWPTTPEHVAYGTTAMCQAVRRLYRNTDLPTRKLLLMGGHEDGVIAFGRSPQEAFTHFSAGLAQSYGQNENRAV